MSAMSFELSSRIISNSGLVLVGCMQTDEKGDEDPRIEVTAGGRTVIIRPTLQLEKSLPLARDMHQVDLTLDINASLGGDPVNDLPEKLGIRTRANGGKQLFWVLKKIFDAKKETLLGVA